MLFPALRAVILPSLEMDIMPSGAVVKVAWVVTSFVPDNTLMVSVSPILIEASLGVMESVSPTTGGWGLSFLSQLWKPMNPTTASSSEAR